MNNNDNNNITTNKKQPSKELVNLVIELKATIAKLKDLYKRIDKKPLEEGFTDERFMNILTI